MPGNLESFSNFKLSQLKPAELNVFTPNYTSRIRYDSTIFMLTNINYLGNLAYIVPIDSRSIWFYRNYYY